tara:strand:+ start:15832 stop:16977 length:1146 start_codon:yes stop_codon:yes gene_type:complete
MKNIKINIVVGGRFHSGQIYSAMKENGYDVKIYTSSPKNFFKDVPKSDIIFLPKIFQVVQKIFKKRVPRIFARIDDYVFSILVLIFMRDCDVLWGFNGSSLKPGKKVQQMGGKYILDRACPHIEYQQNKLQSEGKKLKYSFERLAQKTIDNFVSEYQQADLIVVPSNYSKSSFKDKEYYKKVYVIPLDSNIPFTRKSLLKEINGNDGFNIGIVGGSFLRKGIIYLLRAIKLLDKEDIKLLIRATKANIVSHGESKEIISDLNVEFIPYLNDLNDFYRSLDIFVLPSIDEGFGMVVYEALSNSVPVIASSNVGSIDGMKPERDFMLFKAGNERDLANKILELYNDASLKEEIGKNGKAFHANISRRGSRYSANINKAIRSLI